MNWESDRKSPQTQPYKQGIETVMRRLERQYGLENSKGYMEVFDKIMQFPDPALAHVERASMYDRWRGKYAQRPVCIFCHFDWETRGLTFQQGVHVDWNYQAELNMVSGEDVSESLISSDFAKKLQKSKSTVFDRLRNVTAKKVNEITPWDAYIPQPRAHTNLPEADVERPRITFAAVRDESPVRHQVLANAEYFSMRPLSDIGRTAEDLRSRRQQHNASSPAVDGDESQTQHQSQDAKVKDRKAKVARILENLRRNRPT